MAQAKPTDETFELLEEARANKMLPALITETMMKLRATDPKAAHAALRAIIETVALSSPAHKRQGFFEELLAFLQPN